MSFFHSCAVGNFDVSNLVVGRRLRSVRALPRSEVERLAVVRLGVEALAISRPALRWNEQGYAVIEYIVLAVRPERVALAREIAAHFQSAIADVRGEIVVGRPWSLE